MLLNIFRHQRTKEVGVLTVLFTALMFGLFTGCTPFSNGQKTNVSFCIDSDTAHEIIALVTGSDSSRTATSITESNLQIAKVSVSLKGDYEQTQTKAFSEQGVYFIFDDIPIGASVSAFGEIYYVNSNRTKVQVCSGESTSSIIVGDGKNVIPLEFTVCINNNQSEDPNGNNGTQIDPEDPNGNTEDPDGSQTDPNNNNEDPNGNQTDPNGNTEDPNGSQTDPNNNNEDPNGSQTDPNNNNEDPNGNQTDPNNNNEDPNGNQTDPNNNNEDPNGNQTDPNNNNEDPNGSQTDPNGNTEDPNGNQTDPNNNNEDPNGNQTDPNNNNEDPNGNQTDPNNNNEDPNGSQTDPNGNTGDPNGNQTDPNGNTGIQIDPEDYPEITEETYDLETTVTIITNNYDDIEVERTEQNGRIKFKPTEEYDTYAWTFDGEDKGDGESVLITTRNLKPGIYDLILEATRGTGENIKYYSFTTQIKVSAN